MSKFYQQGRKAFFDYPNSVPDCPYRHGSQRSKDWHNGYRAAHDEES